MPCDPNGYGFILPVTTKYRITSDYGMRIHPVTGEYTMHTGIDFAVEHYSRIVAVGAGKVTFAGELEGFGNCIEVKHIVDGQTVYSFYAHLSRIDVAVGDVIAQGETIGLEGGDEGDSGAGWSTGHHLHFEVRRASGYGNDVSPYSVLGL